VPLSGEVVRRPWAGGERAGWVRSLRSGSMVVESRVGAAASRWWEHSRLRVLKGGVGGRGAGVMCAWAVFSC
jgi:hypothetical protein